ncbi:competence protein CoiA [Curtobacterium flaccumfaciens]|uniref:competence protein CoiA n=1 Tax=Curtobacterium flaccumfaciens TaxID=2035 RepID=UPI00399F7162
MWGDERVEAWALEDNVWSHVRATYQDCGLVMACGEPGIPVERAGTRYFRHKASCDMHEGGPESPEHLATKALVADVAREHGWEAVVEAPSSDRSWIADVLVSKPGVPSVAIEVQWAAQTPEEFDRRTRRYEADGVECAWLVGPKNTDRGLWNIRGTADALQMEIPVGLAQGRDFASMRAALTRWFRSELRPRFEAVVEAVEVVTAMSKCHNERCGAWFSYWWLGAVQLQTRCGQIGTVELGSRYPTWVQDRPEAVFQPAVRAAIAASSLPAATEYRAEHSKQTNTDYTAQHCPKCRWHLGDGFIIAKYRNWSSYAVPVPLTRLPLHPRVTAVRHLCVDVGNGRCAPPKVEGATYPSERNQSGDVVWFNSFGVDSGELEAGPLPARQRGVSGSFTRSSMKTSASSRETKPWAASTSRPNLQQSPQRYQPNVRMTSLPSIKTAALSAAIEVVNRVFLAACRYIDGHSQSLARINISLTLTGLEVQWKQLQQARGAWLKADCSHRAGGSRCGARR